MLYQMRQNLDSQGILFSYSGTISQAIISSIVETVECELLQRQCSRNTIRNIFAVLTEQMQNILTYSSESVSKENNTYKSVGIALLGYCKKQACYYVKSGNHVNSDQKEKIIQCLEKINALDDAALKEFFKESRRLGSHVHDRGAGLGFIEMAKRSSQPLEYTFNALDEQYNFFEITTYLNKDL